MDSRKKYQQPAPTQKQLAALRGAQGQSSTALTGGPFAARFRQGPVPQQLVSRSKTNLPQGYPIGPSSRQGMGSRLGDSANISEQVQKFKGSFKPYNNNNNEYQNSGGPSPSLRSNRSSGVGAADETNVPVTERQSTGQPVKSARHQPKTLTQMKPNLRAGEYTMHSEEVSVGYSTSAFRSSAYPSQREQKMYHSEQPVDDMSRRYPSEIQQARDYQVNQSQQSSTYAAENQIKFQGDLGDDMQAPVTDDDDSGDERREDVQRHGRVERSPQKQMDWGKDSESEEETPQIVNFNRRQPGNINMGTFKSRESQKKAARTAQNQMTTLAELSELEVSQSQIQLEGQSDREQDTYGARQRYGRNQEQRDAQYTDTSDAASGHGGYYAQEGEKQRSKNAMDTATMMYSLKSGPKSKAAGQSRQRQLQAADMSGYEGDQDQYRGQSRGRFQGGKIESRKKKKANAQLVAARNANKKFKDNVVVQTPTSQNLRASQKKASLVPQSQIELNLDEQMADSPEGSQPAIEKQQTGISAISGMSALSLLSGTSALSGAGFPAGEKPVSGHSLKPQTQIVDIQVQPSTTSQPKSVHTQPTTGKDEPTGSEGYQTRPQFYDVDGLRIEHDSQPILTEQTQFDRMTTERPGRVSPLIRPPVKVVDISENPTARPGGAARPRMKAAPQRSQVANVREAIVNMDPSERRRVEVRSAVKIQKWVRGHIARTSARKQKEINFRQMRKLRRMLSVAYGKTRTKLVKQLLHVLKESGNLHCDQNYQLWKKYQAHCATIIQRHWRGYSLRFLQIEQFNDKAWKHKQSRLLSALVKGYKTRLLLHQDGYHQGIHKVRMDILRVANQDSGKALIIDVNDRLTLKNLMKRRRLKVIELIRIFNKAYNTQGIILSLLFQKRKLETQDQIRHLSERNAFAGQSRTGNSTKILSGTQGSQKSLKNVSTLLDYGQNNRGSNSKASNKKDRKSRKSKPQQNQQIGQEFRGSFQNKAHMLKFPNENGGSGDEFLSSHRSPVHENEVGEDQSSEEQEPQPTGFMWPSQIKQQQKEKEETNQLSSFWPSAQQAKPVEEPEPPEAKGGFASFWPSVQQKDDGQKKPVKKDIVLQDPYENKSQGSDDVDWLALPVAKPREEKLPVPVPPPVEKFQDPEDRPLPTTNNKFPGAKNPSDKFPVQSFDDVPVGQHKWQPNPDEERPQVASFGGRGMANQPKEEVIPIDDLPIKPAQSAMPPEQPYGVDSLRVSKKKSSNLSVAGSTGSQGAPAPKGYDFEKMIEAAMLKMGEAPAVMAPEKPEKSPTASGPGAGPAANADGAPTEKPKEGDEEKKPAKPKKIDAKKKALLDRRKKYDPRAAIKKAKKAEEEPESPEPENPKETPVSTMGGQSRNAPDRPGPTKSVKEIPETEETQPPAPNEDQNSSQLPQGQPKPYLKRKTQAVKVQKGKKQQYKVEGKSRIDCWQKGGGDKETTSNTVISNAGQYGNKKRKRQSLLKKNQESRTKLGMSNEGSPSPGGRRQTGERSAGTSPAPFRMNQQKLSFNQMENEPMGGGDERYMTGAREDYPEMAGPGVDPYMNQSNMGYLGFNDPHQQYTNTLLPSSHLSNHLPVQDLETQFNLLHGPNQANIKLEPPPQPDPNVAGMNSMDRAAQRQREKHMADMRKEINSHEFKYSMIPFSAFNTSQEVNLFKPKSRIPFLFKDPIPALQKNTDFQHLNQAPSLFFKCYSDDLYEAILEDYRSHYVAISNQDLDDEDEGDVEGDEYEEQ